MPHTVDIRLQSSEDLPTLYRISRDSYSFNFGHHWEEGGLEVYMDKVFGWELLAAELREPDIHYYVAFVKGVPVAFMKLNLHSSLPGLDPEKGIELDKLYILPDYKGFGIGRRFVELAFRVAAQREKELFWLGVIDTNHTAMAFYEKAGFRRHSTMRVEYPKFKEELRGMWRMVAEIKKLSGGL
jgi:ribosomal protein S18 acetylase RimI-like enzyme